MSAALENVITVTLLPQGTSIARDNMNVVGVMTSQLGHLSSSKRYDIYYNLASVATDYGTDSAVYSHATAFFGTTPNPVNAGGAFVVGYWRAVDEDVDATAGNLVGGQISEAATIGQLQTISDGSFDIDVDAVTQNVTGIDLRVATSLTEVATLIDTAISGASASYANSSIVITSDTTGVTSTISELTAGASGTFIGEILELTAGSGAVVADGAAATTLTAESKVDAVTAVTAQINWKGVVFIDKPTDVEAKSLAEWSKAESVLMYDVFSAASNLLVDVTNPVWDIRLAGLTTYRMMFSKAANRKLATSYMARAHTVNFNAENSALTMNLKTLSVSAEDYTQGEITSAKAVGLDIYTTFKNVPKVLSSGANDFTDNVYNIIAYIDAVQTDMFNLLGGTSTKLAQLRRDVIRLIDQGKKTSRGFVRAGVFGAAPWSSPDYFGDLDTFNRAIETEGFYWLAGSLADQPQDDREARKSPVLQNAVKNAGAIHSVDILINWNL